MSLDPNALASWRGFLDLLRPPAGYRVAAAVGTTYGLSFDTLVAALLAMLDADGEELARDPVSSVMAVTRLAPRVRVLFHPGTIQGPVEGISTRLVGMLDRILAPVSVHTGLFHPKVWVLRFERIDRPELSGLPRERARVVVGSRNLTRSQSFEIGASLEGEVSEQSSPFSRDLASALEAWIGTTNARGKTFSQLPGFVRRVAFDAPHEARDGLRLRWQESSTTSLGAHLPPRLGRAVVVSPFLRSEFLRVALDRTTELRIVSTPEAFASLDDEMFTVLEERASAQRTPVLFAIDDFSDALDEEAQLEGIHAKLLVADDGKQGVTFVGSANATGPGWGLAGANGEAMLELRPGIGVDAFVRGFLLDEKQRPRPWVRPYQREERVPPDAEDQAEERLLRMLRQLSAINVDVSYDAHDRRLAISIAGRALPQFAGAGSSLALDVTPLARAHVDNAWQPLSQLVSGPLVFDDVDLADVSAFVAVRAREGGVEKMRILFGCLRLSDDALDRRDDEARAKLLADTRPEDLLRALVLGISHLRRGSDSLSAGEARGQRTATQLLQEVTLERTLRAVAEDPSLIRDLRLLLGSHGDEGFIRFCDDLEAASNATAGATS